MISDVPTPKDFFDSGIELFDFVWDTAASLITNLSQAIEMGVEEKDVSEDYWAASKRRLTTALAMTQQGVEFVLKGKIAEVSPFLLLAEGPSRCPVRKASQAERAIIRCAKFLPSRSAEQRVAALRQ